MTAYMNKTEYRGEKCSLRGRKPDGVGTAREGHRAVGDVP